MDFYQLVVYALLAALLVALWKTARWTAASLRDEKASESFTSQDMKDLQDACVDLVHELREAADECTKQIESAITRAELVLGKLDNSSVVSAVVAQVARHAGQMSDDDPPDKEYEITIPSDLGGLPLDPMERIYRLADGGMGPAEIAEHENRPAGEVRLILDLRALHPGGRRAA